MQPHPRHTVVMTQTLKASELSDVRDYGPLFIDDGEPQAKVNGLAHFAREVGNLSDPVGSSLGGREQITVEFADGTPGRVFDLDDDVVVHRILPGTDLTQG
jgi:hypothetical protein